MTLKEKLLLDFNTKLIILDSLEQLKNNFIVFQDKPIHFRENAKILTLLNQAASLENLSKSVRNQKYPKINFFAKSSYDYPNGPNLKGYQQNMLGINITMPLFDGGELGHTSEEKMHQSLALKLLAQNEEKNVSELMQLALSQIKNLTQQSDIIQLKIKETTEIAHLVYKSYLEGRSTFLEVERANVKMRESKLALSFTQYQITLNLFKLALVHGE